MTAILALTVATYIVAKLRVLHYRSREEWHPSDWKVVIGAQIVCWVCWLVLVVQAIRSALVGVPIG